MTSSEAYYRLEQTGSVDVIALGPELRGAQWSDIEQVGNEAVAHIESVQSPKVIIDLTGLDYMSSAHVALVVRCWKVIKEQDGRMVVVCRDSAVLEVLSLAGLLKVWTVASTRDEAVELLGGTRERNAGGSRRWLTIALLALSLVALIAAVVGLVLLFRGGWPRSSTLGLLFGGSLIAVVAGVVVAAVGRGMQRILGVVCTLVAACLIAAGALGVSEEPVLIAPEPAEAR